MSGDAEKFDEWPGGDAYLDAGSAVKSLADALKRNAALEADMAFVKSKLAEYVASDFDPGMMGPTLDDLLHYLKVES